MRSIRLVISGTAVALTLMASMPRAAEASELTFDVNGAGNSSDIPTTYGDNISSTSDAVGSYGMGNGFTPNITVDYRTVDPTTNATHANNLDFWSNAYGDLVNVAYPVSTNHLGELSLIPEAGWSVRLNRFDLGGWPGTDQPNQTVRILDEFYNILLDYSPFNVEGDSGHSTFTPNLTHNGILRIQYGPSWNTGLDNVNFDQVRPNQVGGIIPEPGTLALLAAGIFPGAGLALRRARRRR